MTIMPSPGFVAELRKRSRAEAKNATDLRAHIAKISAWLAEQSPTVDAANLAGNADELRRAAAALAHAELLAADCEATANLLAEQLAGNGGQPIEAAARAAVSQPLTPIPDDSGPGRMVPDAGGQLVATTSTIHTDTAPVEVQAKGKGGAK